MRNVGFLALLSTGCLENGRTTPEGDVRPCSYQAAIEPVRAH
jgi:hypothetical protein